MKTWNEMDIKEQKELFVKFLASEIAQSLDAGLEFKANNRAYNGNVGNAYGLSLIEKTKCIASL